LCHADTSDIELEPTKQTWGNDTETRGEDSFSSKIVDVEVDYSLMPCEGETDKSPHLTAVEILLMFICHLSLIPTYPPCTFRNNFLALYT
jgi:hypothetical protein